MKTRLAIPPHVWDEIVPPPRDEGGPPRLGMWWERATPLAADCELALTHLHCTIGELYRRTTRKERLVLRIHLAYRVKQQEEAQERAEQRQEMLRHLREQQQGMVRGRPPV